MRFMMQSLVKVEIALMALLILGYIFINFGADLPRFLIGENLTLATAYAILIYLILAGNRAGQPLTLFVSAFNAGRVSRSIVSPRGELGELALQHVPLLSLILLVSIISLYLILIEGRAA
jgi:hypothetical protein